MSITDHRKKSWNCKRCEFELVELNKNTIAEIIEALNPNFLSLPTNYKTQKNEWIKICPRCNSYPLGLDMEQGFPIHTKSGDTTTIQDLPFVKAHKHTEYQQEILKSEQAGCFYCIAIFYPDAINDWHGEKCQEYEPLALCPECGIDSVLGSASGFPIKPSFLTVMRDFWFSPSELSKTMGALSE